MLVKMLIYSSRLICVIYYFIIVKTPFTGKSHVSHIKLLSQIEYHHAVTWTLLLKL